MMITLLAGGITNAADPPPPVPVYVVVTLRYDEVLFRNTQYALESVAYVDVGRVSVLN
jgi:hypothetical protein